MSFFLQLFSVSKEDVFGGNNHLLKRRIEIETRKLTKYLRQSSQFVRTNESCIFPYAKLQRRALYFYKLPVFYTNKTEDLYI